MLRIVFLSALQISLVIQPGCKPRQLFRPTPQMDIEQQFWVRVLLLDNVKECTLKTNSPFSVINNESSLQTAITQARLNSIDQLIKVEISGDSITFNNKSFTGDELIIHPDYPHIFTLNQNDYRGKLVFIINPDSNTFNVINLVPLEPYLAGVIGAEMPDYWEPEALKAQAIAARTYCLYIKNHFGKKRQWDVAKTQANQVYLGVEAESAQVWNAVNNTNGQVLICKHPNNNDDIFPAYYSSVCGGHTENSKHVFGDSFEPLEGVACPYCKDVAKLGLFFWPIARFDKNTIQTKLFEKYPTLKRLGDITDIIEAEKSNFGTFSRLNKIKLIGSTGKSDFLRAEDLRLTIDPTGLKIKSTICRIVKWDGGWAFLSGRGWGHGVGMCQHGAEGMAREGKSANDILYYYYPGSKIVRIY